MQAVVAGLFVALGWIVNGWQNRRAAVLARKERIRDVHRALYAEIGAYLQSIGGEEGLEADQSRIVARIEADHAFVPFIPSEEPDRVYRAILGDIHILPRTSIDTVVAFYGQLAAIGALIEDMRSDRFGSLSKDRRLEIYRDYIRLRRIALVYGDAALVLINAYAKGGPRRAQRELDRLRGSGAQ